MFVYLDKLNYLIHFYSETTDELIFDKDKIIHKIRSFFKSEDNLSRGDESDVLQGGQDFARRKFKI